jgi:hypothetical protein
MGELEKLKAENRQLKVLLATATTLLSKPKELLAKAPKPAVSKKTTIAPKKRP